MLTEVPARTDGFPAPPARTPRVVAYENRELLCWLLNPDMLRATVSWWPQFEQQQADQRAWYHASDRAARYTKSKNFTKAGEFYSWCRIPAPIHEIMVACDPDLDGTSDKKMDQFLRDHPVFDLQVRGV